MCVLRYVIYYTLTSLTSAHLVLNPPSFNVLQVGRLFASSHANYAGDFHRQFSDFLLRFNDTSIDVRLQMIEIGGLIMTRHIHLFASVETHMRTRLHDPDARVRAQALNKLLEFGYQDVTLLKIETIEAMAARVRDRKIDISVSALTGMAKIYFRHVSSCLPGIDTILSDSDTPQPSRQNQTQTQNNKKGKKSVVTSHVETVDTDPVSLTHSSHSMRALVPPEIYTRCHLIPGYIINSWGHPDTAMKNLVMQLLQEHILPKSLQVSADHSSDTSQAHTKDTTTTTAAAIAVALNSSRVTALLLLFEGLTEQDRDSLGSILGYKTKVSSLTD